MTSVRLMSLGSSAPAECFQRLLDMGAKVNNRTDLIVYFDHKPTRESLLSLAKAGMDVNYVSFYGTALDLVQKLEGTPSYEKLVSTIHELSG
jgi:hypothetical protein